MRTLCSMRMNLYMICVYHQPPIIRRQISPQRTGSQAPEYRVEEPLLSLVFRPCVPFLPYKKRLRQCPNIIVYAMAMIIDLPKDYSCLFVGTIRVSAFSYGTAAKAYKRLQQQILSQTSCHNTDSAAGFP